MPYEPNIRLMSLLYAPWAQYIPFEHNACPMSIIYTLWACYWMSFCVWLFSQKVLQLGYSINVITIVTHIQSLCNDNYELLKGDIHFKKPYFFRSKYSGRIAEKATFKFICINGRLLLSPMWQTLGNVVMYIPSVSSYIYSYIHPAFT